MQGKKCKKFNFFQNQNDTCAHLFTLVMKFHDRQSSERCKTPTRSNAFLFLITDDCDFCPQTCTNGLDFMECKHIKNIFEDVYFTKNSFHITLRHLHRCPKVKTNFATYPKLGHGREHDLGLRFVQIWSSDMS